jgi:hypothetical protein
VGIILTYILDPDTRRLAEKLDGFLFTLTTTGVYLDQAAIGFLDYLCLYKEFQTKF